MILPIILGVLMTLPLGPAGYSIIENSMNHGLKKGLRSLLELQVIEFSYLVLGINFFKVLNQSVLLKNYLEWFALLFLIIFGVMLLFESQKTEVKVSVKPTWVWGILNPGILLLYLSVITYFKGDLVSLIFFQGGTIFAISLLILLALKKRSFLVRNLNLIKKNIGGVFICLGMFKIITNI